MSKNRAANGVLRPILGQMLLSIKIVPTWIVLNGSKLMNAH